jgi:hypothetical protein
VVGELAEQATWAERPVSRLADRFTLGVVLHTGTQHIVLGDRLVAAPASTLSA